MLKTTNHSFSDQNITFDYYVDSPINEAKSDLVVFFPGFGDDAQIHAILLNKYAQNFPMSFWRFAYQNPLSAQTIKAALEDYLAKNEHERIFLCSYSIGCPLVVELLTTANFKYIDKIKHICYLAPVFSKSLIFWPLLAFVKVPLLFKAITFISNKQVRQSKTSNWQQVADETMKYVDTIDIKHIPNVPTTLVVFTHDLVCMQAKVQSVLKEEKATVEYIELSSSKNLSKLGHAPTSWNKTFSIVAERFVRYYKHD